MPAEGEVEDFLFITGTIFVGLIIAAVILGILAVMFKFIPVITMALIGLLVISALVAGFIVFGDLESLKEKT